MFKAVIFFLVVVFACFTALLWWNSPSLIESVVRSQFEGSDFEVTEFKMQKFNRWSLKIDQLTLNSAELQVDLADIEIRPMGILNTELLLVINRLSVSVNFSQNTIATPLSWISVTEIFAETMALLPVAGEIVQLEWCLPDCQSGALSWRHESDREPEVVSVNFSMAEQNLLAGLIWQRDKTTLSVVSSVDPLFLFELQLVENENKRLQFDASGVFSSGSDPMSFYGQNPLEYQVDIYSVESHLTGSVPLDGLVELQAIEQAFAGELTTAVSVEIYIDAENVGLGIQQMLQFESSLDKGVLQTSLLSPIDIALDQDMVDSASLKFTQGLTCDLIIQTLATQCRGSVVDLAGSVDQYESQVSVVLEEFNWTLGNWSALVTAELSVKENQLDFLDGKFQLQLSADEILARSENTLFLGIMPDQILIKQNLDTLEGSLELSLNQALPAFTTLAAYLDYSDFNLLAGDIKLDTTLKWDLSEKVTSLEDFKLDFKTQVEATGMDVSYLDYLLDQGTFRAELVGWPNIKSVGSAQMTWQTIHVGLPLDEVRMDFDLDLSPLSGGSEIRGQQLTALVLGGRIHSSNYNFEISKDSSVGDIEVNLDELELNQILALEDQQFESSGKISGSVPVHLQGDKVSVENGFVSAIEPGGFIRYKPALSISALVDENASLKLVLDALNNFQYHTLEAGLQYSPDGLMVATTSIKGRNPGYENGRDIYLNIRLEENINVLLKSLRLGDDIANKIGKRAETGVRQ